jgi:hypothetical protein
MRLARLRHSTQCAPPERTLSLALYLSLLLRGVSKACIDVSSHPKLVTFEFKHTTPLDIVNDLFRFGTAVPISVFILAPESMRARGLLALAVGVAVWCAQFCTGVHSSSAGRAAGASASSRRGREQPRAAAFAASPAIAALETRAAVARRPQAGLGASAMPLWITRRAGLHQCALLPRTLGAGNVELSMTISGDALHTFMRLRGADDEVKQEYQRADADGTRIFISGLLPSVDEKRLLVLLQAFKGVRDAHLAKPGVGFVLFADPASADAALQRLQGAKLGGKAITARRARSFYILEQQQAKMRDVMEASLAMRRGAGDRASVKNNIQHIYREGWHRKVKFIEGNEASLEEEDMGYAFQEEERIRKQALMELMKEEDVKRKPRRQRSQNDEPVQWPEQIPEQQLVGRKLWEAMTEAPRNDSDLARRVKQRMDNIKRIEKLKRDFSSAPPAAATSASHSTPANSGASQCYRDARRSGVLTSPKSFHNVKLPELRLQHPGTPHKRLVQMISELWQKEKQRRTHADPNEEEDPDAEEESRPTDTRVLIVGAVPGGRLSRPLLAKGVLRTELTNSVARLPPPPRPRIEEGSGAREADVPSRNTDVVSTCESEGVNQRGR